MRALADVMKISRQAQRIEELAAEAAHWKDTARTLKATAENLQADNDALLKYASELVDKCVELKQSETVWKIRAAESRRLGV